MPSDPCFAGMTRIRAMHDMPNNELQSRSLNTLAFSTPFPGQEILDLGSKFLRAEDRVFGLETLSSLCAVWAKKFGMPSSTSNRGFREPLTLRGMPVGIS